MTDKPFLIIPSETKSREFEPKLLLACMAASAGYPVIVGSRIHIHNAIARLPRGITSPKTLRVRQRVYLKFLKNSDFRLSHGMKSSCFTHIELRVFIGRAGQIQKT